MSWTHGSPTNAIWTMRLQTTAGCAAVLEVVEVDVVVELVELVDVEDVLVEELDVLLCSPRINRYGPKEL